MVVLFFLLINMASLGDFPKNGSVLTLGSASVLRPSLGGMGRQSVVRQIGSICALKAGVPPNQPAGPVPARRLDFCAWCRTPSLNLARLA